MAGSHFLQALPAGPLRLATAAPRRLAVSVPLARRTYSSTTTPADTSTPSTPPPPPTAQTATPAPVKTPTTSPPAASANTKRGPFFVGRTPSNNLPIYEERKKGGTNETTLVRKVEGDAHTLKEEVIRHLGLDTDKVRVNPATNHVRIKGHVKSQLIPMLGKMGF